MAEPKRELSFAERIANVAAGKSPDGEEPPDLTALAPAPPPMTAPQPGGAGAESGVLGAPAALGAPVAPPPGVGTPAGPTLPAPQNPTFSPPQPRASPLGFVDPELQRVMQEAAEARKIEQRSVSSPFTREGYAATTDNIQVPTTTLSDGTVGVDVTAIRGKLVLAYADRIARQRGYPNGLVAVPDLERRKEIESQAYEQATTVIQKAITGSTLPWIERDPKRAAQIIAEGKDPLGRLVLDHPVTQLATQATAALLDQFIPEDVDETKAEQVRTWLAGWTAPFFATLEPASTTGRTIPFTPSSKYAYNAQEQVSMGQDVRQLRESSLWFFSRTAPSTAVLSWALDPHTDMEFGSEEHIRKIRSGYDVVEDWRTIGDYIADAPLALGRTLGLLDESTEAPNWVSAPVGVLGTLGVVLFEPDLISLSLAGAGKTIKVAKVLGGVTESARLARSAKALSEAVKLIERQGDTTKDILEAFQLIDQADPHLGQFVRMELGADMAVNADVPRQVIRLEEAARKAAANSAAELTNLFDGVEAVARKAKTTVDGEAVQQLSRLIQHSAAVEGAMQSEIALAQRWHRSFDPKQLADPEEIRRVAGEYNTALAKLSEFSHEYPEVVEALVADPMLIYRRGLPTPKYNVRQLTDSVAEAAAKHALVPRTGMVKRTLNVRPEILKEMAKHIDEARRAQAVLTSRLTSKGIEALVQRQASAARLTKGYIKELGKLLPGRQKEVKQLAKQLVQKARVEGSMGAPELIRKRVTRVFERQAESFQEMSRRLAANELDVQPTVYALPVTEDVKYTVNKRGERVYNRSDFLDSIYQRYTKRVADKILGNEGWYKALQLQKPPTAAFSADIVHKIQQFEAPLAAEAKLLELADSNLLRARAFMDAWQDPTPVRGMNLGKVNTWIPAMEKMFTQLRHSLDPSTARLGIMDEVMHEAEKSLRASHHRLNDEIIGISNRDEQWAKMQEYLETRAAIEIDAGTTLMNQHAITMLERWKGFVSANAHLEDNVALEAVARMWLPEADIPASAVARIRTNLEEFIKATPHALSEDIIAEVMRSTSRVLAAVDVGGVARAEARLNPPAKARAIFVAAVGHGAIMYDTAQRLAREMGPAIGQNTANMISLATHKEIKGIAAWDQALAGFVRMGLPITSARTIRTSQEQVLEFGKQIAKLQADEATSVFLPKHLLDSMERSAGKIVKELDQFHTAPTDSILHKATSGFGLYMAYHKRQITKGIAPFINPSHWVANFVGDMSQMVQTEGLAKAAKLGFQNVPTLIPVVGRVMQDAASRLSDASTGKPVVGSILNALWNPVLHRVFDGSEGFIKTQTGRVISYDDLRKWAVEDEVFDTFYRDDALKLARRAAASNPITRAWTDADNLITGHLIGSQQRQRMGLYIEYLSKGATRQEARTAVRKTLYDWTNAVTDFEAKYIASLFVFYRYFRLSTQQAADSILEPLTKPSLDYMQRALRGDTQLARIRQTGLFVQGMPDFLTPDRRNERLDDAQQLEYFYDNTVPWWAKTSRPVFSSQPMLGATQLYYQGRYAQKYTAEGTVGPALTTLDSMSLLFTGIGAMAGLAQVASGGEVPDRYWEETVWKPWIGLLNPAMQEMAEQIAEDTETYNGGSSKLVRLNEGEVAIFKKLEKQGFISNIKPTVFQGKDGRLYASAPQMMLWRMLPFIGDRLPGYVAAQIGAQNKHGMEAAWHIFKNVTGIARDVRYDPLADHDRAVKVAAQGLKNEVNRANMDLKAQHPGSILREE